MRKEITKEQYDKMVEKASPDSPILKNCIKAFIVGGIICTVGQIITNIAKLWGADVEEAGTYTSVILVVAASLLTGLGLYSKLGKFAGAGSIVPITGFSNSVTSPAIEFKTEGYILGIGANMFKVAGPVLVYGITTSGIIGFVYWLIKMFM